MNTLFAALWAETLKSRRSKVPFLSAAGFTLAPIVGGLFMIIMKDPEAAQKMGLLGTKAQLTIASADWITYFGMLGQSVAVGGGIVFAVLTAWVFGREFSEKTAKDLMAIPVPRGRIVLAKTLVTAGWVFITITWIYLAGLTIGALVDIPLWTWQLAARSYGDMLLIALMTLALLMPVAFMASVGRGYLPPLAWAILTIFFSQIIAALGYGSWFPWAVPALFSGIVGPRSEQLGLYSYALVVLTGIGGYVATDWWWHHADLSG